MQVPSCLVKTTAGPDFVTEHACSCPSFCLPQMWSACHQCSPSSPWTHGALQLVTTDSYPDWHMPSHSVPRHSSQVQDHLTTMLLANISPVGLQEYCTRFYENSQMLYWNSEHHNQSTLASHTTQTGNEVILPCLVLSDPCQLLVITTSFVQVYKPCSCSWDLWIQTALSQSWREKSMNAWVAEGSFMKVGEF